jgi:acetyl-CoA carboxylase biotin carboxyl carrier protein
MIDLGKVEKLMALMAQYGVDVVQAETGPEKISLAKNASALHAVTTLPLVPSAASVSAPAMASVGTAPAAPAAAASASAPAAQQTSAAANSTPAPAAKVVPEGTTISSPFVGTFYRSPSPDSPFFVDVGTRVKKGQTLCIVEAMKLMNEIESELDGEVVAILIDNAKPVEFGTPLFVIRP